MHECNKESAKVPVRTDRQVPVELACRQRGRKYLLLLPATSGSVGHTACHREAKGHAHQSSQHSGFRPSLHECPAAHRLLRCEAQVSWSPPNVPLLETGEGPPPAFHAGRDLSSPVWSQRVRCCVLTEPVGVGVVCRMERGEKHRANARVLFRQIARAGVERLLAPPRFALPMVARHSETSRRPEI